MNSNFDLLSDRRGTVAIVLAAAALPVFGLTALAVDQSGQSVAAAEVGGWIDEACNRVNSQYFASQDLASRVAAAESVLSTRSANAAALPDNFAYTVSELAGDVHIETAGTSRGLVGDSTADISFSVDCNPDAASPSRGPIFIETFEYPLVASGWSWEIFSTYPNWIVDGYGPQVVIGGIDGVHPAPMEGAQYVELDSNWNRGGTGLQEDTGSTAPNPGQVRRLNSSIEREVYLAAGSYELTYSTRRKIPYTTLIWPNDMDLGVFFEDAAAPSFSSPPLTVVGNEANWTSHSHIIDVTTPGLYRVGFRAQGEATKFGALLDDIRLVRM